MHNKRYKLSESLTSLFYTGAQDNLASFLDNRDLAALSSTYKPAYVKFKSNLDTRKVLLWCIRGNVKPLVSFISQHPQQLFVKADIADECTQQFFYHISAFQLILFLGDWDLLKQITPFIQEQYLLLAHTQSLELRQGGADLVNVNFNPSSCAFSQLLQTQAHNLSLPLLQNPDGIFLFEDRLYYVNQHEQSVNMLPPIDDHGYQDLISAIHAIHPNSSCRSSDAQHQWINTHYDIKLHREGIAFKKDGQFYRDTKIGCQLLHSYRQYLHLVAQQPSSAELQQHWISNVGHAQRQLPVHLMQRLCANDKFSPLRSVESYRIQRFIRRDMYDNHSLNRYHDVYPLLELGQSFALCKGSENKASSQLRPSTETVLIDLQAFNRLFKLSLTFNLKWFECLSEALNGAANPFNPLLVTVNALQTQPRVVDLLAYLPQIIILKLTDFLQEKSGQLVVPIFQELLQKIVHEENYFIKHVWPSIRRNVHRYTEMELGRYMTLEIDDIVLTFKVKMEDLSLFFKP